MAIENLPPQSQETQNSSTDSTSWERLAHDVPFTGEIPETDTPAHLELPTKSPNRTCNFYIRQIQNIGRMPTVESFINSALQENYQEFTADTPEFDQFTNSYAENLDSALDHSTKVAIHEYSGNGYKAMNQVSRGFWDYEVLGKQTPEALAHAQELNEKVHQTIISAPSPDIDFTTYRGTDLNTFRGYNVSSISDLKNLENQFFLESGFCSTSLLRDKSFTNDNYDAAIYQKRNVEIKYLIPKDSHECIGLLTHDFSQYPEENEFLINSDSFSYISKVDITPDQSSAHLEMILIPRSIYDPAYSHN